MWSFIFTRETVKLVEGFGVSNGNFDGWRLFSFFLKIKGYFAPKHIPLFLPYLSPTMFKIWKKSNFQALPRNVRNRLRSSLKAFLYRARPRPLRLSARLSPGNFAPTTHSFHTERGKSGCDSCSLCCHALSHFNPTPCAEYFSSHFPFSLCLLNLDCLCRTKFGVFNANN